MAFQQAHRDFRQAETCYGDPRLRKSLYLNSAKNFFYVAKKIHDKATQEALVYLGTMALHKAENMIESGQNTFPKVEIGPLDTRDGRLTTFDSDPMTTNMIPKTSPPPVMSTNESVTDLLQLEHQLANLGLMRLNKANVKDKFTENTQNDLLNQFSSAPSSTLSSALGDSLMLLTSQHRKVLEDRKLHKVESSEDLSISTRMRNTNRNTNENTSIYISPSTVFKSHISNTSINLNSTTSDSHNSHTSTKNSPVAANWNFNTFLWNTPASAATPTTASNTSTTTATANNANTISNSNNMIESYSPYTPIDQSIYGKDSLSILDTTKLSSHHTTTVTSSTPISLHSQSTCMYDNYINNDENHKISGNHINNPTETHKPSSSIRSSSSVGVTDMANEGILKLLKSIETLSNENNELIKKLNYLSSVESQNFNLRKDMENFKLAYAQRFTKLKDSLKEFAIKHPHPHNPANAYVYTYTQQNNNTTGATSTDEANATTTTASSNGINSMDNSPISPTDSSTHSQQDSQQQQLQSVSSDTRRLQLEKTIKGLLIRLEGTTANLEKAKHEVEKKDKQIAKYEAYYKELKKSVEKRELEKKQQASAVASSSSAAGTTASPNIVQTDSTGGATGSAVRSSTTTLGTPITSAAAYPLNTTSGLNLNTMNSPPIRHKNPTTTTLEASLHRSALMEKKDKRR